MANTKYKIQKNGYFQTSVWDGTYKDYKKHYIILRSKKSSKDLENKVNEYKRKIEERKRVRNTDITFCDYAASWRDVYKKQKSSATNNMYQNIIEKHFCILGNTRLHDIDRIHLQLLLNNADSKPRTQQQILLTFKQVLKSAVADKLFPANVMEDIFMNVQPIKYRPKEKRPLTEDEKKAVFAADLEEKDKVFLYILYGCGLRRSEALALTRFDINLKVKELSVNRAFEFVNGQAKEKDPKTFNGFRTVPIPDKIFPTVNNFVKNMDRTYLFTMSNCKPVSKSSYDKMWAKILKAMQSACNEQIDGLTAHIFRHNYCTNLCYQIPKISIKKIAQLLGDTERMVLEVYNHMILDKEDAAGAVGNALNF